MASGGPPAYTVPPGVAPRNFLGKCNNLFISLSAKTFIFQGFCASQAPNGAAHQTSTYDTFGMATSVFCRLHVLPVSRPEIEIIGSHFSLVGTMFPDCWQRSTFVGAIFPRVFGSGFVRVRGRPLNDVGLLPVWYVCGRVSARVSALATAMRTHTVRSFWKVGCAYTRATMSTPQRLASITVLLNTQMHQVCVERFPSVIALLTQRFAKLTCANQSK